MRGRGAAVAMEAAQRRPRAVSPPALPQLFAGSLSCNFWKKGPSLRRLQGTFVTFNDLRPVVVVLYFTTMRQECNIHLSI